MPLQAKKIKTFSLKKSNFKSLPKQGGVVEKIKTKHQKSQSSEMFLVLFAICTVLDICGCSKRSNSFMTSDIYYIVIG